MLTATIVIVLIISMEATANSHVLQVMCFQMYYIFPPILFYIITGWRNSVLISGYLAY